MCHKYVMNYSSVIRRYAYLRRIVYCLLGMTSAFQRVLHINRDSQDESIILFKLYSTMLESNKLQRNVTLRLELYYETTIPIAMLHRLSFKSKNGVISPTD